MFLVYVGESGVTGPSAEDPNQPHHVFLGLLVHENQWEAIRNEFSRSCRRHFGRDLGEDGTPTRVRAAEVLHGTGSFSTWPWARRLELLDELLAIPIRYETPIIVSYMDKQEFARAGQNGSRAWSGSWEPPFSRFVFCLGLYMDDLNMAEMSSEDLHGGQPIALKERAAVIAGNTKVADPRSMQRSFSEGLDLPSGAVIDSLYFARPEDSHCTQLADLCAYFVRRHLEQPSRPNPHYEALDKGHLLHVVYAVQL